MTPPTPAQARIFWFALTFLALGAIIGLFAAGIWALGKVLHLFSPVLWPLAIAAVVAYLLDPLVDRLERRKMRREWAIIFVFGTAVLVVLAIGATIVPRLVEETRDLATRVPSYTAQIQVSTSKFIERLRIRSRFEFLNRTPAATPATTNTVAPEPVLAPAPANPTPEPPWEQKVAKAAVSWITSVLPGIGSWLLGQFSRVAGWFGLLAGIALVPVYCFYFLKEKWGIQRNWARYLPVHESKLKNEAVFILTSINDYLIVFFRGQVLVAACDAVLYTIGFFSIGLSYALLLGLMAGMLSIIPYLGAVLTVVPATVLAAVQYRDWLHPVLVLAIFGAVQAIEGLFISPRIIGDRVGLHPLTIIVAVMVGTTLLGGILGGILAIPLTAALRVLMFRYVWKAAAEQT